MISIDPGKRAVGWALWEPGGLVSCGYAEGETPRDAWQKIEYTRVDRAVVELMRHSRERAGSVANDLIDVQAFGSALAGICAFDVEHVTPKTWKGDVPKKVMEARIFARLSREEFDRVLVATKGIAVTKRHNVIDAIGIGLWKLRRL